MSASSDNYSIHCGEIWISDEMWPTKKGLEDHYEINVSDSISTLLCRAGVYYRLKTGHNRVDPTR